jgi:cardiolipin synthase A/B
MPHRLRHSDCPLSNRVRLSSSIMGPPPPFYVLCFVFYVSALSACTIQRPLAYRIEDHFTVADPQFAQTIGNLLGPPLLPGNTATTLLNGDQIFPAMLDAIRSAQKTITFETYIYWGGDIGHQFATAFAQRAQAGVKVHIIIDALGSAQVSSADYNLMKNAGAQLEKYHALRLFDPISYSEIDHRTHRKLLIVDGKIGFTGGVGIADIWTGNAQDNKHWRDNHYRLEGPAVAQLQAAFADNWMKTAGVVLQGNDYFPPLDPVGHQFAQVFKSSPAGGSENMQLLILMSIAHAQKNIRIQSAYFVPDKRTLQALIEAAQRGVKIEIIVPGRHIDEKIVRSASRAAWGGLLKAGIDIYEYRPTMIHTKLLIVDDLWTSIGSSNMDGRSFRINDEANLNILDKDFAAKQTEIFEADKSRAHLVTFEEWKHRPLWDQLTDHFANSLGPEL